MQGGVSLESAHEQAEAAIESLGGLDSALQSYQSEAPQTQQQDQGTPEVQATPEQQPSWSQQQRDAFGRWAAQQEQSGGFGAPEAPNVQTPDSTFAESFDPNTLTPELQARYKQMQADYTRKTQELSQLRQQYEPLVQLGNPEELQEAIELRSMLQDPRNWVELHRDLTAQLREIGYSPQEAQEAATQALHNEAQPQTPAGVDLSMLDNDPELAPLKQYVEGLKNDVNSVKSEFNQWREQQEAQAMEMAVVGEIQRSVNAIRQSRPDYSDQDIDAIFELASYHDGDMFAAQKRYDQIFADRMNRWMASKQTPQAVTPNLGGAGTVSQADQAPKTWADARARALEFAAQLDQS